MPNRDCFPRRNHQQELIHAYFSVPSSNASERSHISAVNLSTSFFFSFFLTTTTGALPGLLHPQRRQRPGAPAHRQHLHEPAEAARVLRPEPDEEQAVVRHRVVLRVRAELRRSGGEKKRLGEKDKEEIGAERRRRLH